MGQLEWSRSPRTGFEGLDRWFATMGSGLRRATSTVHDHGKRPSKGGLHGRDLAWTPRRGGSAWSRPCVDPSPRGVWVVATLRDPLAEAGSGGRDLARPPRRGGSTRSGPRRDPSRGRIAPEVHVATPAAQRRALGSPRAVAHRDRDCLAGCGVASRS